MQQFNIRPITLSIYLVLCAAFSYFQASAQNTPPETVSGYDLPISSRSYTEPLSPEPISGSITEETEIHNVISATDVSEIRFAIGAEGNACFIMSHQDNRTEMLLLSPSEAIWFSSMSEAVIKISSLLALQDDRLMHTVYNVCSFLFPLQYQSKESMRLKTFSKTTTSEGVVYKEIESDSSKKQAEEYNIYTFKKNLDRYLICDVCSGSKFGTSHNAWEYMDEVPGLGFVPRSYTCTFSSDKRSGRMNSLEMDSAVVKLTLASMTQEIHDAIQNAPTYDYTSPLTALIWRALGSVDEEDFYFVDDCANWERGRTYFCLPIVIQWLVLLIILILTGSITLVVVKTMRKRQCNIKAATNGIH